MFKHEGKTEVKTCFEVRSASFDNHSKVSRQGKSVRESRSVQFYEDAGRGLVGLGLGLSLVPMTECGRSVGVGMNGCECGFEFGT